MRRNRMSVSESAIARCLPVQSPLVLRDALVVFADLRVIGLKVSFELVALLGNTGSFAPQSGKSFWLPLLSHQGIPYTLNSQPIEKTLPAPLGMNVITVSGFGDGTVPAK